MSEQANDASNKTYHDSSIEKGQAFLMQKITSESRNKGVTGEMGESGENAQINNKQDSKKFSQQVKKSSTSSTSSTSKAFRDTKAASIQHKNSTEPTLKRGELVEEFKDDKGNTKQKLLIESKAALIFQEMLSGFLAHDHKSQTWHEYTGSQWKPLETAQEADRHIIRMLYEGTGELGFRTGYKNGVRSILTDGQMLPLPKQDVNRLPFVNGLLLLDGTLKGRLTPITPDNAYTWCLPYAHDPKAKCPRIRAWISQAVDGDTDTVNFLRAWMAAVLHGRADLQKFLHLKGSGGTGKGVFMRLLTQLVGKENTVDTQLDQLEQNRFETSRLHNKRLALITESDKYGGSINVLKAITGQDQIRLERKHQQQTGGFLFGGMVVMASNESMQTTDHTSGLDRRRITVIFDRRATNDEKQAWEAQGGEEAILHSEIPGLVNWLLELSQTEISDIIRNPPKRIRQADEEAMRSTNPLADWINDCCEADPNAWTQIGHKIEIRESGYETTYENADSRLYPNYLQWCSRANKTPLAQRRFKELVIQTCGTLNINVYESRLSEGRGLKGIRLKSEHDGFKI